MIELIDNIIQMFFAAVVFSVAFFRAFVREEQGSDGSHEWTLIGLFAFEYFIGDLYNILYLIAYDTTSQYFYISELSWYTAYLFLILLLIHFAGDKPFKIENRFQYLIPVYTVAMAIVFYVRNGDAAGNIVSVVIMTVALQLVTNGLISGGIERRPFYLTCLIILALEYALWISSSLYWPGDTLGNPYFWIDTLFSVCLIGLIHALSRFKREPARKAVRK
ncbi:MAG: hypothetical protein K6G22_06710 [Lachnospiraceae bacterium]|nr:hypothetical protein [Lachnospiraceae bacterium]